MSSAASPHATVYFYYDIVCPFAYLASTQIRRICDGASARLVWKPMLLGGVLNSKNGPDPKAPPQSAAKARGTALDIRRQADFRGVELSFPPSHPRRTLDAMRLLALAELERPGEVEALTHALYRAYWVLGRDLTDRGVLGEIAAAHHLDPSGVERPEVKARLRATTDEAIAEGIYGAPSFIVEGTRGRRLFFGQDRMDFVEQAVRGYVGDRCTESIERYQAAPGAAPREVAFYFDYVSPYTYLASTQIERIAAETGARITWRPIFLGGVFKELGSAGVPMNTFSDARRMYMFRDMNDWAKHWGVPFRFPSNFPILTVTALRLSLLLDEKQLPPVAHAIFHAFWAEDQNIADPTVLGDILTRHGHDAAALLARASSPAIKAQLAESTLSAVGLGVFGLPTFQLDGELYFGQDRIDLLSRALTR